MSTFEIAAWSLALGAALLILVRAVLGRKQNWGNVTLDACAAVTLGSVILAYDEDLFAKIAGVVLIVSGLLLFGCLILLWLMVRQAKRNGIDVSDVWK